MKKYVLLYETTETLYNLYSLTYPSLIPFTGKIHFHSPVSLALAISTVAIQLYGSLIDIKILPPSYQLWLNSWLIEKRHCMGKRLSKLLSFCLNYILFQMSGFVLQIFYYREGTPVYSNILNSAPYYLQQ